MNEKTYGSLPFRGGACGTWLANLDISNAEIAEVGQDILESEELTYTLYSIYLSMITEEIRADKFDVATSTIDDAAIGYLEGYYVPCCKRAVLTGQFDVHNDHIPDFSGWISFERKIADDQCEFSFNHTRKLSSLPRGWASPVFGTPLAVSMIWHDRYDKYHNLFTRYVVVARDGRVLPAVSNSLQPKPGVTSLVCATASICLGLQSDSRFLWNVQAEESVVGRHKTPLRLGVNEEHVKSLFYARSLPTTESGRKRPILHWIRSHKRRLASGIDVDVSKHLRGITKFEMDSLNFSIVSPKKAQKPEHT